MQLCANVVRINNGLRLRNFERVMKYKETKIIGYTLTYTAKNGTDLMKFMYFICLMQVCHQLA